MIENVSKISVIGGPGTGKSKLTNNLGKELNLPVYHIEGINYLENWKPRDKEERDKMILDIANKEQWIIDGTYKKTLAQRIGNADMVIFLDYSTPAKLKGIFSRYLKGGGQEKPEIPGCKEKMDISFIKQTMRWNKEKRKLITNILEENKDKKIKVFSKRTQLNKWYEQEFNKKIEL